MPPWGRVPPESRSRRRRQADLTAVAWVAAGELAYDDWLRQGGRLGVAGRSSGWWIGDWVRYGAATYGQRYAVTTRVTGYNDQTLMNMVYVATRFEISRRRENLSWSHHAELAALDREQQEFWLNHATANRLSVQDLRRGLFSARNTAAHDHEPAQRTGPPLSVGRLGARKSCEAPVRSSSAIGDGGRLVACPHCGQTFVDAG